LCTRDDPVLARRERGDLVVRGASDEFCPRGGHFSSFDFHAAIVARIALRVTQPL
jgi:hypothetical protein